MYITLPQLKKRCSQCGAIGETETVTCEDTVASITYIICVKCGHKKEISRTTWYIPNTGTDSNYYTFTIPQQPEYEDF